MARPCSNRMQTRQRKQYAICHNRGTAGPGGCDILVFYLLIHPHVSRHHAMLSGNHTLCWRGPCWPRGVCFHGDVTVVAWVTTLLLEEVRPQSWAGINLLSGRKPFDGTDKRQRLVVLIRRIPRSSIKAAQANLNQRSKRAETEACTWATVPYGTPALLLCSLTAD